MATGRVCSFSQSSVFLGHNKTEGIKELLNPFKGSSPFKTEKEFRAFRMTRLFGNLEEILMVNLKKKIMTFSDILDLPPPDCSHSIQQLMMKTIKDLQNLYPEIVPRIQLSEMEEASINQVLDHFFRTLKSIKSSWAVHNDSFNIVELYMRGDMGNGNTEQRVERVLGTLDSLIGIAREKFDIMEEDEEKKDSTPRGSPLAKFYETCSDYDGSCLCGSPATPTSVLPVMRKNSTSYSSPVHMSLRVQAMRKLNPIDVKRLSFHMPPHAAVQDFVASSQNNTIVDEIIEDAQVNKAPAAIVEETKEHYTETEEPKDLVTAPVTIPREPSSEPKLSPTVALVPSGPTTTPLSPDLRSHLTIPTPPPPPRPLMLKPNVTETYSTLRPPLAKLGVVPAAPPLPPPPPERSRVLAAPSAMPPLPPSTKLAAVSTTPPPPLPPPKRSGTTQSAMPPPSPPTKSVTPPPPPPPPKRSKLVIIAPSAMSSPLPPPSTKSTAPPPRLPLPERIKAVSIAPSRMPPLSPLTKSVAPPLPPLPPGRPGAILAAPPPPPLPSLGRSRSVLTAPSVMPPPSAPAKLAAISPTLSPLSSPNGRLKEVLVAPSTVPPPPPPTKIAVVSITPSSPSRMSATVLAAPLAMPPPPPVQTVNGVATPPPLPVGPIRSLRAKKATKLKRSSQMGNLYRLLKGKVEGKDLSKSSGIRRGVGGSGGGGKGMADALAEMTKRSAYFQKIEEDVQKYAKSITELKSLIGTFQTKDMAELLKFQKQVESVLESLTDESQVLARFEGFPSKRLETLRTATALYSKLEAMVTELQNWKIEAPLKQLLDKAERYFNKIKGEIEPLERTKDEEIKKFQTHNIHFDFSIIIKIKELTVDVSSSCMELALKESRKAKAEAANGNKCEQKAQECVKMLWRAFQFAFRVYSFAGGHDDRADNLTRELAHAIDTIPSQN